MMALRFPQPQMIYRHILVVLLHWIANQLGATILPKGWMMFDPELAKAFDNINTAIIYQKITSWIESNARRKHNIINGKAWSYNSYPDWARKEFIWLHSKTVGSHIRKLEQMGRLVSDQLNPDPRKREKWYSSPDSVDGSQLRLWQEDEIPMVAVTSGDDSNKALSKVNPSKAKRQTTPAAARARTKPLKGAAAVATFPASRWGNDLPEPKPTEPDYQADEGACDLSSEIPDIEQSAESGERARTPPPVSAPPSPGFPAWMDMFTLIDAEIRGWYESNPARLQAVCEHAAAQKWAQSPGGLARTMMRLPDFWPPKAAPSPDYSWAIHCNETWEEIEAQRAEWKRQEQETIEYNRLRFEARKARAS